MKISLGDRAQDLQGGLTECGARCQKTQSRETRDGRLPTMELVVVFVNVANETRDKAGSREPAHHIQYNRYLRCSPPLICNRNAEKIQRDVTTMSDCHRVETRVTAVSDRAEARGSERIFPETQRGNEIFSNPLQRVSLPGSICYFLSFSLIRPN